MSHLKSVVGGGELFCFASARNCNTERNLSPHPLYINVENNLKWLFSTQGNQARNAKFDQTKFGIFKMRVLVRKI